MLFIYYTEL